MPGLAQRNEGKVRGLHAAVQMLAVLLGTAQARRRGAGGAWMGAKRRERDRSREGGVARSAGTQGAARRTAVPGQGTSPRHDDTIHASSHTMFVVRLDPPAAVPAVRGPGDGLGISVGFPCFDASAHRAACGRAGDDSGLQKTRTTPGGIDQPARRVGLLSTKIKTNQPLTHSSHR